MAITSKTQLKQWFVTAAKPNQAQFHSWIDAYWHKSEEIPMGYITGLSTALANKADAEQLQHYAKKDASNIAGYAEQWKSALEIEDINTSNFVTTNTEQDIESDKTFHNKTVFVDGVSLRDLDNGFNFRWSAGNQKVVLINDEDGYVLFGIDQANMLMSFQNTHLDFSDISNKNRTISFQDKNGTVALLSDIPVPEIQVQADWNQTDALNASFIKNKPTIPSATSYGTQRQLPYVNATGNGFSYSSRFTGGVTSGALSYTYQRLVGLSGEFTEVSNRGIMFSNSSGDLSYNLFVELNLNPSVPREEQAPAGNYIIKFQPKNGTVALLEDIEENISKFNYSPKPFRTGEVDELEWGSIGQGDVWCVTIPFTDDELKNGIDISSLGIGGGNIMTILPRTTAVYFGNDGVLPTPTNATGTVERLWSIGEVNTILFGEGKIMDDYPYNGSGLITLYYKKPYA